MRAQGNAVVTGASRGIGRAVALELARRGFDVIATMRRPEDGAGLATELGDADGTLRVERMDVTDGDSIVVPDSMRVLVNNAGTEKPHPPFEATPMELWREMYDTNVFGLIDVTRRAIPSLRAAGGGVICNVTSSSILAPVPFYAVPFEQGGGECDRRVAASRARAARHPHPGDHARADRHRHARRLRPTAGGDRGRGLPRRRGAVLRGPARHRSDGDVDGRRGPRHRRRHPRRRCAVARRVRPVVGGDARRLASRATKTSCGPCSPPGPAADRGGSPRSLDETASRSGHPMVDCPATGRASTPCRPGRTASRCSGARRSTPADRRGWRCCSMSTGGTDTRPCTARPGCTRCTNLRARVCTRGMGCCAAGARRACPGSRSARPVARHRCPWERPVAVERQALPRRRRCGLQASFTVFRRLQLCFDVAAASLELVEGSLMRRAVRLQRALLGLELLRYTRACRMPGCRGGSSDRGTCSGARR